MKDRLRKMTFYKKKIFYIILIIVFSFILAADTGIAKLIPSQKMPFGDMSQKNQDFSGEMPDMSEITEDFSGQMPSVPEGTDGEMPDMFQMPGGTEGEMPDNGNTDDAETNASPADVSKSTQGTVINILQTVKSHWKLIAVIFAILDAASIFMLVKIIKKERKEKELLLEAGLYVDESGLPAADRKIAQANLGGKASKHSHYIWIIAIVVLVALSIIASMFTKHSTEEQEQTSATIYTETVSTGSIDSVVPGTGTLTDETAVDLEIPSDVEVLEWYVSNGDAVTAGDKLAQVDKVSVMSAIVSVQEKLTELDEALEEHADDEISDTVTATADGRVKKIYAQVDASVVDTMYESGALMLISLDGMMAVSLDTEQEFSVGDTVAVVLSDGTSTSGKVESLLNGTLVVTVSDKVADHGETVTVETEEGTVVGSGELYIHSELKVTGFSGTISSVNVSENEAVSNGETLLTLSDTDYEGEYELLLAQRTKLENQIQVLFQLYQEQYIYAGCEGVITGLDEDAAESGTTGVDYNTTAGNVSVQMLSTTVLTEQRSNSDTDDENTSDSGDDIKQDSEADLDENANQNAGDNASQDSDMQSGDRTSEKDNDTEKNNNTSGNVEEGTAEQAGYETYVGVVSSVQGNAATINLLSVTASGNLVEKYYLTLAGEKGTLPVYTFSNGTYTPGNAADIQTDDILMLVMKTGEETPTLCIRIADVSDTEVSDENKDFSGMENMLGNSGAEDAEVSGNQETVDSIAVEQNAPTSMGDADSEMSAQSEMPQSTADALAEAQENAAMEAEIQETYSVETTTWMSIIPQEKMEVSITVDEMDVLYIEVGQEATVTLDAFPGQSFAGIVTGIDLSGTNDGGSSKYTVVVSIDREVNMLSGMNASIKITLDTKENVLVIPEKALVEQESGVYVYTTYDDKTDTLGGLVEVTTGASDGENVEILSGLEEGSEYCYSYLDVVNYTTLSISNGGFSAESIFGGKGGGR